MRARVQLAQRLLAASQWKNGTKFAAYAYLIALRLARIEADAWETIPDEVQPPMHDPNVVKERDVIECTLNVAAGLRAKKHRIERNGAFYQCEKCRKRRKLASNECWTTIACVNGESEDLISLGEESEA